MEYALSDQQRADYEENGYLIVRDVLPPDETRALREVVEAQAATDAYPPKLHYPEPGKYTVSGNKLALDPEVVNDTLGVLLKYQDDIAQIQGSEAARILDKVNSELARAS